MYEIKIVTMKNGYIELLVKKDSLKDTIKSIQLYTDPKIVTIKKRRST